MTIVFRLITIALALWATESFAGPNTVASMQWSRRVLLVSSPDGSDRHLEAQRKAVRGWSRDADARDVSTVQIVGDTVEGASDKAADLRRLYDLPSDRFAVALVGKDGSVAVRSDKPVTAASLTRTIDAMPMRRAGQR